MAAEALGRSPLELGSKRELFVDSHLIDHQNGTTLKLHEPRLEAAMSSPANAMEYGTVIHDGDLYRLYTRDGRGAAFDGDATEVTRYCESRDGIQWTRPKLGLHEVDGSRENNVILHEPFVCHNFAPFLDARPGVATSERFKALGGVHKGGGLVAFRSADGVHWTRLVPTPVIRSKDFAFDSQNVAFWSELEGCYVCYFRTWKSRHGNLRTLSRTTSTDFQNWTEPVALDPNFPGEHLYTSQTHPYFRAPHLYIATPTRFHPERGESTDILFMTARGPARYDRTFREAWIRPGLDPARWGNRSNYAARNVVQTGPEEMSVYATPFRRFTLRLDGFASLRAGADVGEMTTLPLRFAGAQLHLNYATSAGGHLKVEIQEADRRPVPGYSLADFKPLVGDAIDQTASWKSGSDLARLSDRPLRLRFVMQEADIFALRFQT